MAEAESILQEHRPKGRVAERMQAVQARTPQAICEARVNEIQERKRKVWQEIQQTEPVLAQLLRDTREAFGKVEMEGYERI